MKKFLSIFLAALMALSVFSVCAFAEGETNEYGEPEGEYQEATPTEPEGPEIFDPTGYTLLPMSAEGLAEGTLYYDLMGFFTLEGYDLDKYSEEDLAYLVNMYTSTYFPYINAAGDTLVMACKDGEGTLYISSSITKAFDDMYCDGAIFGGAVIRRVGDAPYDPWAGYVLLPGSPEGLENGAYYYDKAALLESFADSEYEVVDIAIYVQYDEAGNVVMIDIKDETGKVVYSYPKAKGVTTYINEEGETATHEMERMYTFDLVMLLNRVGVTMVDVYAVDGFVWVPFGKENAGFGGGYYIDIDEAFADLTEEERAEAMAEMALTAYFYNPTTGAFKMAMGLFYSVELDPEEAAEAIAIIKQIPTVAIAEESDKDVAVYAEEGVIEEGAVLTIVKADETKNEEMFVIVDAAELADLMEDEDLKEAYKDAKIEKVVAYDVSLLKDNAKVQPNGEVTITMPVPEGFDAEKIVVLHVKDDGSVELAVASVQNGVISIIAGSFSYYVVAQATTNTDAEEPSSEEASSEEPSSEEPSSEKPSEPASEEPEETTTQKTEEQSGIKGFFAKIKQFIMKIIDFFKKLLKVK